MVSVSVETAEQTEQRLRTVLAHAELVVLPGRWSFSESPITEPPPLDDALLAVVRDEDSWSVLRPHEEGGSQERFGVFSFHFPAGMDNSGFVGWLASALKTHLGTGVFVLCGSNTDRGGVYDYWGCPEALLDRAVTVVEQLAQGAALLGTEERRSAAPTQLVTTEAIHALVPFARHLGIVFQETTPDLVIAQLPERAEFATIGGGVHGGAQMALADIAAAAMAVLAGGDLTAVPATAQSTTHFLEPARGLLTARATVLRRGRMTMIDVTVTDGAGAVTAVIRQTVAVLRADVLRR